MFYYREGLKKVESSRADELREANKIIQDSIDNSMRGVVEELKTSGLSVEEQNEILKSVKRQAQIEAIKLFKEKVKAGMQSKHIP
jgi:hypothetical protein